MTYRPPKDRTPEDRRRKHATDKRYELRVQKRIDDKKLFDEYVANPAYYDNIEHQLRQELKEFDLAYSPNETVITWRGTDGEPHEVRDNTKPGAILLVWHQAGDGEVF